MYLSESIRIYPYLSISIRIYQYLSVSISIYQYQWYIFTHHYYTILHTYIDISIIAFVVRLIYHPYLYSNLTSLLHIFHPYLHCCCCYSCCCYIHTYYNCLYNLVIYHQSIIPTCTAISHPYLHTNLTSLPTYIHCCCHCCHSCYTHTTVVVAHDAHDVCAEVCKFLLLLIDQ